MRGRECTVCPPWVVRCAHWGDEVLVIQNVEQFFAGPCRGRHLHLRVEPEEDQFSLFIGVLDHGCYLRTRDWWESYDDLEAAKLAFERREAELLGREVPA